MVCVIVASMQERDLYIPQNSFLIAADQGFAHLQKRGIQPNLTVGDFDSLGYVPEADNLVQHPVQKDDTDMLLAVREGLKRGATHFILYGGLGGRLDHTIANIQTLAFIREHGAKGMLFGEGTAVCMLQNDALIFSAAEQGNISVFAFSERAEGVTERGLLYALENASLTNRFPLGVSNEFVGKESVVSVQEGKLLLVWQTTAEKACETFLR
ncbi:MAG: thiamine diphosphokinase [Acutalibacteraceae bacterium]